MPDQRELALKYTSQNRETFLDSLKEVLSIPSISTDVEHEPDMLRAAEWSKRQLQKLGMKKVQVISTSKYPIVYGEHIGDKKAPTVLIYGHYDVQPVDPVALWKTPPFEPTRRGENLYARGASDMKGQVVAALKAIEALVETGGLQVNIKWLIEGEEEIGSPSLGQFIKSHKGLLASDFALNLDSGMIAADSPSITYALRGLAYFELRVYGPQHDLHSGLYGGVVHNPAIVLADLIAGMHDDQGRVTLPGFYDKVRPLSKEERNELARLPMDAKFYLSQTGVPELYGEVGYSPVECIGARPTLDVNGILSGFTGEGIKTVIPAVAMAKISTRLVPDQAPEEVHQQLLRYIKDRAPKDISWELTVIQGGSGYPSISERDTVGVNALCSALETVWGKRPYFKREGGSIPVVLDMQQYLGLESVLSGFGLPDDNLHAPNEKLHLPTWYRGIDAIIHFFLNL